MDVDLEMTNSGGHHDPSRLTGLQWGAIVLAAVGLGWLIFGHVTSHGGDHGGGHGAHEHMPSYLSVIPFAVFLLCIAILPLISSTAEWWESNKNRLLLAAIAGSITLTYYFFSYGVAKVVTILEHAILAEYIPFIVLLFALYVISGGISLKGDLPAHPATNTSFLAVGAFIASLIGTTGASMLLIRPLLQTNSERKHVKHTVIFFIFLVSNVGGCLLPIGDPPLFLGYLRGVSFFWTLQLWPAWLAMTLALLTVYYIWDRIVYRHETKPDIVRDETRVRKLTLTGKMNLVWLLGVVVCVAMIKPGESFLGLTVFPFMRELMMLGLVVLSLVFTKKAIREGNQFNYHAIIEVAALFIGIFICMQAPIEILQQSGAALEPLLSSPSRFFWATGALSSFLDNAPTYVVFFETATSMTDPDVGGAVVTLAGQGGAIAVKMLVAISLGAVFMGAMTYIGNGPNFMVKSIAEQSGIRMPSFFGYMGYSCAILLPLLVVISLLFL